MHSRSASPMQACFPRIVALRYPFQADVQEQELEVGLQHLQKEFEIFEAAMQQPAFKLGGPGLARIYEMVSVSLLSLSLSLALSRLISLLSLSASPTRAHIAHSRIARTLTRTHAQPQCAARAHTRTHAHTRAHTHKLESHYTHSLIITRDLLSHHTHRLSRRGFRVSWRV